MLFVFSVRNNIFTEVLQLSNLRATPLHDCEFQTLFKSIRYSMPQSLFQISFLNNVASVKARISPMIMFITTLSEIVGSISVLRRGFIWHAMLKLR